VIEHAHGTHPDIQIRRATAPSTRYDGVHSDELLAEPLDTPPDDAVALPFDRRLAPVRRLAADFATRSGLGDRAADVALAVGELATNSVRHGGGSGTVHLWRSEAALVCEVRDRGRIVDPLIGRRKPVRGQLGGRGLWVVNQVCDLVQIRSTEGGSTVRVHLRLP
jgi:anti-sigma regulatory factor (Ser/Thr protein kinase)